MAGLGYLVLIGLWIRRIIVAQRTASRWAHEQNLQVVRINFVKFWGIGLAFNTSKAIVTFHVLDGGGDTKGITLLVGHHLFGMCYPDIVERIK